MPCRLQPYIWISDDALAQAYRRFARICHHHHHHHQHQHRRHGSNVPGPLEARRRLAKRRMVGLAMSPAPSLMPDFASLLGSGGLDVASLWKPPAPVVTKYDPPPLFSDPPAPPSPIAPQSVQDYRHLLGSCSDVSSVANSYAKLHGDAHDLPVNFSKAAFRCLADSAAPEQLLEFLQSGLNHQHAHNTRQYLQHLYRRDFCPKALSDYVTLVCDKIALATISDAEVVDIIHDLPHAPQSGVSIPERHDALAHACNIICLSLRDAHVHDKPPQAVSTALLKALCSLPPLPHVLDNIFTVYAWLPPDAQSSAQPSLSHYLYLQIKRQTRHTNAHALLAPLLTSIPSCLASEIVSSATVQFLTFLDHFAHNDKTPDTTVLAERLLYWLRVLRECTPDLLKPLSPAADIIYPEIASRYPLSQLSHHFMSIRPSQAVIAILHYWIKPAMLETSNPPRSVTRRLTDHNSPLQTYGVTYTLSARPLHPRQASPRRRTGTFDQVASDLEVRLKNGPYLSAGPFIYLFTFLSRHNVNYSHWLDEIFRLLIVHKSPTFVFQFSQNLIQHNIKIPYSVAIPLINFFLDSRKPAWAMAIFNRPESNQWLSTTPETIFALIDVYPIKSEFLFLLLNRPDFSNSLPKTLRSSPQNTLSEERVNLIHHIAYALSKSPHLTSRMALRRVQDCLRYLTDHNAALSPLISRALVFAGVTRPLQENKWLSTVQFSWILDYVRRLEGHDVAEKLDQAAWGIQNQNWEVRTAHMKRLQGLDKQADLQAWEFRKRFGHASHRWKRLSRPFKPYA